MSLSERLTPPNAVSALALCAALLLAPPVRAADTGDSSDSKPSTDTGTTDAAPASAEPVPDGSAAPAKPDEAAPAAAPTPETDATKKNAWVDPITGAALGSSGERQWVHALTKPGSSTEGKFDFTVTMPVQVNPKFTEHIGNGLEIAYHIREPLAIFVGGTYFWHSQPTDFTDNQLLNNAGQAPTAAEAVWSQWEAHGGLEFTPVYAKMAFFGVGTLRFGVFVGVGAGVTDTKAELQPPSAGVARTFGDAGLKPTGFFNAGFRFFLGDHFAIRLEIRDVAYSAYVSQVNGCTQADAESLGNGNPGSVSAACAANFPGAQGKTNAHYASALLQDPSTEIINTLQFALGLSVLF